MRYLIFLLLNINTAYAADLINCYAEYKQKQLTIPCIKVEGTEQIYQAQLKQIPKTQLSFQLETAAAHKNEIIPEIGHVYDGDTFRVQVPYWPPILDNIRIRIRGIDTPEIKGKCDQEIELALSARDFTRAQLANATDIRLLNLAQGTYFRLIADVMIDGISLADLLLENNHARIYKQGQREDWC